MSVTTNTSTSAMPSSGGITSIDLGLLILRLGLGTVFFAHGAQKIFGWFGGKGLEATVSGMVQGGIPAPLAFLAAFTEFFGALAVLSGLLSRLASLGLFITMMVAIFGVHISGGFFLPKGFEYAFSLGVMALTLIFTGPGRIAIADIEAKLFRRGKR
jgi:putative oxidoreductase